MTKEALFDAFDPISDEGWQQKIETDLKGKAVSSLNWEMEEGMLMAPYYRSSDLAKLPNIAEIQQANRSDGNWKVGQRLVVKDVESSQKAIALAVAGGVEHIHLEWSTEADFNKLWPSLEKLAVSVACSGLSGDSLNHQKIQFGGTDWVTNALLEGRAVQFPKKIGDQQGQKQLYINAKPFKNAGANAVDELAMTLSLIVEHWDHWTENGLSGENLAQTTWVELAMGTSYFREIAKVRALRYLWYRLLAAYETAPTNLSIHATGATIDFAAQSPYVNLLRGTTISMAAAVGGCDVIHLPTHDGEEGAFSQRMARNIALIAKKEAYLNKVGDAAAGTYYVESMTQQLADLAWEKFLSIEATGGLIQWADSGAMKAELDTAFKKQLEELEAESKVMVGVNKYQTEDAHRAEVKPSALETAPLQPKRLSDFLKSKTV